MRRIIGKRENHIVLPVIGLVFAACEVAPSQELQSPTSPEVVESSEKALTNSTWTQSLDGVNIQIRVCRSDTAQRTQSILCSVDYGYIVIGGGAYAEQSGKGAFITESRVWDFWNWLGSSGDDVDSSPHYLTVYAVGMRLDGINSEVLKSMVANSANGPSGKSALPSLSSTVGTGMLSGGATATATSGSRMFLSKSIFNGSTKWDTAGRGTVSGSQGTLTNYFTKWTKAGTIVEGFGALDIKLKSGTAVTVTSGSATATVTVDPNYVPAGYGGLATTSSGKGRMLYSMGMDSRNLSNAIVMSKDHQGYASKGTTTAYITEVAHVAGSHGLCNEGPALAASLDPCIASVCTYDSYCCNNYWDMYCINEVATYCPSRPSCSQYTCSHQSYNGDYWNNDPAILQNDNCYNYATNTETGTKTGRCAQPGVGSGRDCEWINDLTNGLTKLAECVKRDGLISVPTAACPSPSMDLLVLMVQEPDRYHYSWVDYHFLRQDQNTDPVTGQRLWSQKLSCRGGLATNYDNNVSPPTLITDPIATATRGGYPNFVGYFCACSSSIEGQGHSVIY